MDHAWDVPPFHDPLNVSLLEVTHKLHVRLEAYAILMKPMVPKMPKEVGTKKYDGRLKQPKPLL